MSTVELPSEQVAAAHRYLERCRAAGDRRSDLLLLRELVAPADALRLWLALAPWTTAERIVSSRPVAL